MADAQIPITVTRSAVRSGSSITLPDFTGYSSFRMEAGESEVNFSGGFLSATLGDTWGFVSGDVYTSPLVFRSSGKAATASVMIRATPTIVIATNAPAVFTNSIAAVVEYQGNTLYRTSTTQFYIVTIMEDSDPGVGNTGMTEPVMRSER